MRGRGDDVVGQKEKEKRKINAQGLKGGARLMPSARTDLECHRPARVTARREVVSIYHCEILPSKGVSSSSTPFTTVMHNPGKNKLSLLLLLSSPFSTRFPTCYYHSQTTEYEIRSSEFFKLQNPRKINLYRATVLTVSQYSSARPSETLSARILSRLYCRLNMEECLLRMSMCIRGYE